jgi:type I restriction enzyme S subunit
VSSLFQSIPDGWQRTTLRHLAQGPKNGAWGSEAGEDEIDAICVRVADFDWSRLTLKLEDPTTRSFKKQQFKNLLLQRGDIVIEKSGGGEKTPVGRVVSFDEDVEAVTSNFVARIRPHKSVWNRFFLYLLAAHYMSGFSHQFIKQNTGIQNLDDANLFRSDVWVPDLATQRQVADFLDRETARIDLLIEKKRRLVALWNERIDAEISIIVLQTDRLESDLVETGVDWLGRVPRSWQLSRIGWELQEITYGFTNPMPTEDEGPFLLTANDVNYGRILWESARHTSQHAFDHDLTDKSRPRNGDVLLTKDGTLGRVAIHDGRPACINQSVALLRPRKNRVTSEFLANILLSRRYQDRMVFEAGGTTIKHIYITRLEKMPFPVPPLDEQRSINAQIDATRQKVGLLGVKITASIDRLKEYRSALITAAVTGQIDVSAHFKSGTTDRRLDALQEEMLA